MKLISQNSAVFCAFVAFILLALPALAIELPDWQSTEDLDHPLAGKIVNSSGQPVGPDGLIDAVRQADYILLGEIHDNPDHHTLQALVISQLGMSPAGAQSTVVFEMLGYDKQAIIDSFMTDPDPARFGEVTGWNKSGWPDWKIYQPIMEAAVDHEMAVRAGSPDRETVRRIGRQGINTLEQDRQIRFGLDITLSEQQEDGLLDAVEKGHCGLMPQAALEPMMWVQRLRDGALADAMMSARQENGGSGFVILVAGSGHVREDYAVPAIIRNREPEAKIVTISFREVVAGENDASNYFGDTSSKATPDERPYDFLWFTPRTARENQCERLRERMKTKN